MDSTKVNKGHIKVPLPIPSMYGIFTYIWLIFMVVNVGKYTNPMDPMVTLICLFVDAWKK